jgi:hypothetical protein
VEQAFMPAVSGHPFPALAAEVSLWVRLTLSYVKQKWHTSPNFRANAHGFSGAGKFSFIHALHTGSFSAAILEAEFPYR